MAAPIQASTQASSGVNAHTAFDSSGFSVNYGTQQTIPTWVWLVAAGLAAVWLLKGRR